MWLYLYCFVMIHTRPRHVSILFAWYFGQSWFTPTTLGRGDPTGERREKQQREGSFFSLGSVYGNKDTIHYKIKSKIVDFFSYCKLARKKNNNSRLYKPMWQVTIPPIRCVNIVGHSKCFHTVWCHISSAYRNSKWIWTKTSIHSETSVFFLL